MKLREHDPLRLDVVAFAADGRELVGDWPGLDLQRLSDSQSTPQDSLPHAVQWRAIGERRISAGASPQLWLQLSAQTTVWLTCQRCLQPFEHRLDVHQRLRFARDEAEAEALDAETEDDVLALRRWFDLRELVEDELILALPLVPRHEVCAQPLPMPADAAIEDVEPTKANPFAQLQSLKTGGRVQ